ncbi:low molecular weight phosphotyrosine protein phosphatase [Ruania sp. N2-46]|uniref:protein-tyrosine-phosphatase n=2 Tax=Occultella gossypii TaxID=2800820 RepID=A0ABS7SEQ2_9MICO|nr:low molecular weight phosphotyrosine protein phosphatase [Occultella gossypii]
MAGMADLFTIAVVCTGNICRSPIGEVVIRDAIADAGLTDRVRVFSAGTGDWHLGEDADHRALAVLSEKGHRLTDHRARRFAAGDFTDADLILALDQSHVDTLLRLAPDPGAQEKVRLLRSFDPDREDDEVADPYYGDRRDFEISYAEILAATPGVVAHVRERLP